MLGIPVPYMWMAEVALVGALCATSGYGGWHLRGMKATAVEAKMRSDDAAQQQQAIEHEVAVQKDRDDEELRQVKASAQIDQNELAKMKEAKDETDQIAECVRHRTCGLRIAAVCPAANPGHVPTPSASASVGSPGTARLAPDAEQAYLALRAGINTATGQLRACQAELKLRTGQ